MRTPPSRYRRSALDLSGTQAGDVTTRDSAGGDIYHEGADATAVLAFLRDYVFAANQERETALKTVSLEIRRSRDDMGILSDAVRSVRDRLDADDAERVRRQAELDRQLAIQRRWLAALTLAVLVALATLAVLVWREAGALALRAAYDAAAPPALTLRRHP